MVFARGRHSRQALDDPDLVVVLSGFIVQAVDVGRQRRTESRFVFHLGRQNRLGLGVLTGTVLTHGDRDLGSELAAQLGDPVDQVVDLLALGVGGEIVLPPLAQGLALRKLLVEQVTGLVRWRESVLAMKAAGVDTVIELGAGKVLSGLVKRIDRDLAASSAGTPAELEAVAKGL